MRAIESRSIIMIFFIMFYVVTGCKSLEFLKSKSEIKVRDLLGREIVLRGNPKRIVSLVPSVTEILFLLGEGKRVVGVTEFDDYPPEVKNIPRVGGFKYPNIELVVSLKPDVVVISNVVGKHVAQYFERLNIPTLVLDASNIDEMFYVIETLGRVTGRKDKAEEIIANFKEEIDKIKERTKNLKKKRVLHIASISENFVAGKGTFIDTLIEIAGGENIVDRPGWIRLNLEEVVRRDPEIIITSPHAGRIEDLKKIPAYRDTTAIKEGKILILPSDIISRPTPRLIIALREIARFVHPEVF
ncbi:MAG: ABC transporter substrate-binding protein [Thermosulfidibacteraceae bacterium]|jgi:iron complex transport system substrate-binding protein